MVLIDGMNHVLKIVGDDMASRMASYGDPTLPVTPGLIEAVSSFVNDLCSESRYPMKKGLIGIDQALRL